MDFIFDAALYLGATVVVLAFVGSGRKASIAPAQPVEEPPTEAQLDEALEAIGIIDTDTQDLLTPAPTPTPVTLASKPTKKKSGKGFASNKAAQSARSKRTPRSPGYAAV